MKQNQHDKIFIADAHPSVRSQRTATDPKKPLRKSWKTPNVSGTARAAVFSAAR
tara:strand:- start:15234 stop:15395 length:162 start_codon:yes stop_codon:yes gene_type:complete